MSARATIFIVAGIIVISATILFNIEAASTRIVANFNDYYLRQTAQNIAQSGVNLGLRQLAASRSWRTGFPLMEMLDGKVSVSVADTTFLDNDAVWIISTGIAEHGNSQETRALSKAYVYIPDAFVPLAVKALITANGPIASNGTLIIDAREHTATGTLISNQGTYAIWTSSTFIQGGSSDIGGTADSIDYSPSNPVNPAVVKTLQVPSTPQTPDSALGGAANRYSEGTLKAIAQSGVGGSQYVTDPTRLTYPLRGVTYVELPTESGENIWGPADLRGSGVLIVHNSAKNAVLENSNWGTFTGLVMVDDMVHFHAIIIGAIIIFTQSPSEGNVIGNGNGTFLYSNEAIRNAIGFLPAVESQSNVIAWWE
ncbi:MAG: hypothetical protein HY707_09970 [Ignavibacteriae bacterium]|nr:hypothetical protein [Ignavibacteriota bacterium]